MDFCSNVFLPKVQNDITDNDGNKILLNSHSQLIVKAVSPNKRAMTKAMPKPAIPLPVIDTGHIYTSEKYITLKGSTPAKISWPRLSAV